MLTTEIKERAFLVTGAPQSPVDGKPNIIVLTTHSSLLTANCDCGSSYYLQTFCRSIYSTLSMTLPLLTLPLFCYCLIFFDFMFLFPLIQYTVVFHLTNTFDFSCHLLLMFYYQRLDVLNLNIQLSSSLTQTITLVHMGSLQLSTDFSLTSVSDCLGPASTHILLTLFQHTVHKESKMH